MSISYSASRESDFKSSAIGVYDDRTRLTRLLTLQQSLLTHVMQSNGTMLSFQSMVEKVCMAFEADGLIIAIDKTPAIATNAEAFESDPASQPETAPLLRSKNVPVRMAEHLGGMSALEGCDGPIQPDIPQSGNPFVWYWAQAIGEISPSSVSTIRGRIIFLFRDKRVPGSEERLAMRSIAPHIQMVLHSVTQHEAITTAHERFHNLASTIPGVVYQRRVRPNGEIRYTYISETARELFGIPAHEILTNPNALFSCYAPEFGDTFRKRLLQASRDMTIWDVEAPIVMPSGEIKYTHAIARPEKEPDGSVLWTGIILDATRIKQAEQKASATEARTRRSIIDSLPQGFVLFDANDKLVLRNKHFDKFSPAYAEVLVEGATYVDVVRTELQLGPDHATTEPELEKRLAERLRRHNERRYFTVERQVDSTNWVMIGEKRTEDGGTIVLFTNINDLKQHELDLRLHTERLERANAELQNFAFVASHDLQEPLRKIEAFGDRLITRCGEQLDEKGRLYTDRMMDASSRMRQLINDLLSYSRVGTQESISGLVDLQQIARDVIGDLSEAISEKKCQIQFGPLPTIEADPLQMRQLFQNLLSNSIKYSTSARMPDIEIHHEPTDDGTCLLQFTDNGIGFEQEHAEQIFDVFQRLHGRSEYAGTGIGLATCRRIVERHNGHISAISRPDVGTIFSVILPVQQQTN